MAVEGQVSEGQVSEGQVSEGQVSEGQVSEGQVSVEDRVGLALEDIREAIQQDGGDVEFVSYDEDAKTVYVNLTGACVGCPASMMTLKMGVERAIKHVVPEVEFVEAY